MIASGSDDKTVRLWDVNANSLIHSFTDHTGMVSDVKFHPDGTCIASCSSDRKIKIFDNRSHRLLQHYDAHDDLINSVAFHPKGTYLLSTSNDGKLKIWDLRKGQILYTLLGHQGPTASGTFSPGGDYFCSGGKDSTVMIWKAGLTNTPTEIIAGVSQTKIETELYVTEKDKVDHIPAKELPKKKAVSASKTSLGRPSTAIQKG
jgi:centriolar protein POC1